VEIVNNSELLKTIDARIAEHEYLNEYERNTVTLSYGNRGNNNHGK